MLPGCSWEASHENTVNLFRPIYDSQNFLLATASQQNNAALPIQTIFPFLVHVHSIVNQLFTTSPSDKPQRGRQGQHLRRHEITGILTSNIDVHCASMTLYWIALLQIYFASTQNVIRKASIPMSRCQAHFALLFENVPPVIVTNVGAPENAIMPPDSCATLCLNVPPSIVTVDTPLPLQYTFCGSI